MLVSALMLNIKESTFDLDELLANVEILQGYLEAANLIRYQMNKKVTRLTLLKTVKHLGFSVTESTKTVGKKTVKQYSINLDALRDIKC